MSAKMSLQSPRHPSRAELLQYWDSQAVRSLIAFAMRGDPNYRDDPCHHVLASYLEAFEARRISRLIISMPPQHGKSRLCSVEYPAWAMARKPGHRFILGSYGADLSEKHTGACLDRVRAGSYMELFPDVGVRKTYGSRKAFVLTNGSSYRGTGVGGSLTGHSADTLIIDDPFKSFEEAHSERQRNKVWDWYLGTALTRLQSGGGVLVISTRWHTDDLIGRLTDPKRQAEVKAAGIPYIPWIRINLQGIAKPGDPLKRPIGEALAPGRFSREDLLRTIAELGSYKSAALYDGEPKVEGGNHFDRKNVRIVPKQHRPGQRWVRFWDLAATEDQRSDRYASVRMTKLANGQVLVAAPLKGVWSWPKARTVIKETAIAESKEDLVNQLGIEAQGGFATAVANLREVMPKEVSVREVTVHADKLMRALPWVAQAENHTLLFEDGPGLDDLFTELEEFPNGAHDDQWDAMSGAHWMLGRVLGVGHTLARPEAKLFGDQGTGQRLDG